MNKLKDVVVNVEQLTSLKALRDHIAAKMDATNSMRDTAALSRALQNVLTQIAELEAESVEPAGNPLSELAEIRRNRKERKNA